MSIHLIFFRTNERPFAGISAKIITFHEEVFFLLCLLWGKNIRFEFANNTELNSHNRQTYRKSFSNLSKRANRFQVIRANRITLSEKLYCILPYIRLDDAKQIINTTNQYHANWFFNWFSIKFIISFLISFPSYFSGVTWLIPHNWLIQRIVFHSVRSDQLCVYSDGDSIVGL